MVGKGKDRSVAMKPKISNEISKGLERRTLKRVVKAKRKLDFIYADETNSEISRNNNAQIEKNKIQVDLDKISKTN